MECHTDRGLPFVVSNLWRAPHFPEDIDTGASSIFPPLDTTSQPLRLAEAEGPSHFDFTLELPGGVLALDALNDAQLEQPEPRSSPSQDLIERDLELDPWKVEEICSETPALCTWESFNAKDVRDAQKTAFLSEAGVLAFDTAAKLHTGNEGVLPQDFVLRAMCNLAVGRASSLYQWSALKNTFELTLPSTSISGCTGMCSDSVANSIMELGNAVVRLGQFRDVHRSAAGTFPALRAMKHCVMLVLDAVDQSISAGMGSVKTILQLQHLIQQPQALLSLVTKLVDVCKPCASEEEIISAVSDQVWSLAHVGHDFTAVMRCLLAKISAPWLERLAVELGLCDPAKSFNDACVAQATKSGNNRHAHGFLDDSDEELISETKAAIALLRELDPPHPLLGTTAFDVLPHYASFAESAAELGVDLSGALSYETCMLREIAHSASSRRSRGMLDPQLKTQAVWLSDDLSNGNMDDSAALMSRAPDAVQQQPQDDLTSHVMRACKPVAADDGADTNASAMRSSAALIDQVRPLIATQHRLVNGVLLRQLLRDHNLRRQLEAQRAFQLFGSGDFLDRLSTALFSPDVQSAERKRGVMPTGAVMGLRLGSSPEQRWPPASSELRLTLANVLQDSQRSRFVNESFSKGGRQLATVPISFAIRELPEEEIDRVLDVQSVHALDFLRLQYDAPPLVDAILDSESLSAYDVIFRFLLKLIRQIYVTTNLPRRSFIDCVTRGQAASFAKRSHQFISVLLSHFMDLGIDAPWRDFMSTLDQLERSVKEEDAAGEIGTKTSISIAGLRALHKSCLERIRNRLYLRRKHQKMRLAMEDVFAAILQCSAVLTASREVDAAGLEKECRTFDRSCSQLLDTLQQSIERSSRTLSVVEAEDAEISRLLLLKLRWPGGERDSLDVEFR